MPSIPDPQGTGLELGGRTGMGVGQGGRVSVW